MRVEHAPYALLLDQTLCELAIICGGIRIAMTGEEATVLWAQIGTALINLYAGRPERCPAAFADFLMRQLVGEMLSAAKPAPRALDTGLQGIADHARQPVFSPNDAPKQQLSSSPP